MAMTRVNGVQLFYEVSGSGDIPLILTHGSWGSHHDWDIIVPKLAESFRVYTYDRRGHSASERLPDQGSITEDVDDLAALIDQLGIAPAWALGNSYGASIVLRLAGKHPDLLQGLTVHEPPLLALLMDDPDLAPMLKEVNGRVGDVVKRIASGDHAGAAQQFFDTVAIGPGAWESFPPASRETFTENAPTFLDEAQDPQQLAFDLAWIEDFDRPCLLTTGEQSPVFNRRVVDRLADVLPQVEVVSLSGAGHIPHITHPDAYVGAIDSFIMEAVKEAQH